MIDANFSCTNCHDPHYILPIKAILGSPEGMAAMNRSCLQCHAEGKTPADVKAAKDKLVAKHKRISFADTHLRRTPCVACHTPAEAGRIHLILPASKAIDDCAMCHSKKSLLTEKFSLFLSGNETPERGWSNAALYNSNVYLTGATRNLWIDRVALLALVLALAGIGAHALLRLFFGCFRRKS
jgi:hypothetical protein